MTDKDLINVDADIQEQRRRHAVDNLLAYVRYTMPTYKATQFHKTYAWVLNEFIHGRIKKLMVSAPPQHGKSQLSSIHTPAMMIGRNPDLKIATTCYSATQARKFGRKVKQLLDEPTSKEVFGDIMAGKENPNYVNTSEEIEMAGREGSLRMVGYLGGLTGARVDVLIMDDLYAGWAEANSPLIRDKVIDWYISVADSRLHNDSQQLIVFTRWHEEDLVGFIEAHEEVILINSKSDVEKHKGRDVWFKINFQAIKDSETTEIDPREQNEPLWPDRHSLKKLQRTRKFDEVKFEALQQGNPTAKEGLLYSAFKTYLKLPENIISHKNYTDTADMGDDDLCSINYDVCADNYAYIKDVYYTPEPMEVTEPEVALMLTKGHVREVDIESNNGGRGFGRKIDELTPDAVHIEPFTQTNNKESRIISNSATVVERIIMPADWAVRWPRFYKDVTKYKRVFKANKHDDGPDVLTGIAEFLVVVHETW